jgi:Methyltransferase domain
VSARVDSAVLERGGAGAGVNVFAERLSQLDLGLFAAIRSQSNEGDKRSWLAIQLAVRNVKRRFVYLEIGSYLGGSIQPYLVDPNCTTIYSIDKRPIAVPDDRGVPCNYENSTTARMIDNLRAIDPLQAMKIICFEAGVEAVPRAAVVDRPDVCFIDGEHTQQAVLRDFEFCRTVCADDAIIYFHDANVVYRAIAKIMRRLSDEGVRYTAVKLDGLTFAIALGDSTILGHPVVKQLSSDPRQYLRRMRLRRLRERVGSFLRAH